jgi:hypothetical protein
VKTIDEKVRTILLFCTGKTPTYVKSQLHNITTGKISINCMEIFVLLH